METYINAVIITKDHIWQEGDTTPSRHGKSWTKEQVQINAGEDIPIPFKGNIKFKLFDDDEILYYEGWLLDDEECLAQQFILQWAMHDAGCTIIKVQREGTWVQEID